MKLDWRQSRYIFHVHSTYTDGKLTVTENVRFAEKAGASTVIFLEHIRREPSYDVKAFMSDVERVGNGTVRAVLGFEAKLLSDGTLDINEDCLASAAVVGIAEHGFPNDRGLLRDAFLNVVRTYPQRWPQVTFVWVHPGLWFFEHQLPTDRDEAFQQMVVGACRAGVLIEQNLKHGLPSPKTLASLPAESLITGVDAHSLSDLEAWLALNPVATFAQNGSERELPVAQD